MELMEMKVVAMKVVAMGNVVIKYVVMINVAIENVAMKKKVVSTSGDKKNFKRMKWKLNFDFFCMGWVL